MCNERHRFDTLMEYFRNYEEFHIDFMASIFFYLILLICHFSLRLPCFIDLKMNLVTGHVNIDIFYSLNHLKEMVRLLNLSFCLRKPLRSICLVCRVCESFIVCLFIFDKEC